MKADRTSGGPRVGTDDQARDRGGPDPTVRPFDGSALYRALDERRREEGLSWAAAARQMWELSSELNARRHDHPVSPSTLSGLATRPRTSCQHALFMLRWLGRSPESFLVGSTGDDPAWALPEAGPDRRLRWKLTALHAAMDERRRDVGLTWAELASVLGCSPNQLTGLRTARFATNMDLAMRIVQWLGRPATEFIHPARW